jgi:hypothetical protein
MKSLDKSASKILASDKATVIKITKIVGMVPKEFCKFRAAPFPMLPEKFNRPRVTKEAKNR